MAGKRNNLIEQIKTNKRAPSIIFKDGDFVQANASAQYIPLTPNNVVQALCLQDINSSSTPHFAVAEELMVDGDLKTVDRFLVDVSGTAAAGMQLGTFDIDASDAGVISVAAVALTYGTLSGTFAVGELVKVTSGPSQGSEFIVVTDNGATAMTLRALTTVGSGQLAVGNTLLGETSAATAAVASAAVQLPTQFKMERFISATSCEFSILRTQ